MTLKHIIMQHTLKAEGLEGIGFEFRDSNNASHRIAAILVKGMEREKVAEILEELASNIRAGENFVFGADRLTTKEINYDDLTEEQKTAHLDGLKI